MIKKLSILALTITLFTSCVSKKIYTDLEDKYANLKKENRSLTDEMAELSKEKTKVFNDLNELESAYEAAVSERDKLQADYAASKNNLETLKASYKALEENSSASIAKNAQKNRELLAQLEAKEQALAAENERLNTLKQELESRSQRVAELENVIASKDAAMHKLKDAISKALTNFEGKGLTVEQRNGKVYISMENKLLFESGSWYVGAQGAQAVKQLGSVLAENPEISVLIEGHTDNVPYKGNAQLSGNWDLSAKRATAIVNETSEGKAKNRRIEVILTPKLDEISKLLNEI